MWVTFLALLESAAGRDYSLTEPERCRRGTWRIPCQGWRYREAFGQPSRACPREPEAPPCAPAFDHAAVAIALQYWNHSAKGLAKLLRRDGGVHLTDISVRAAKADLANDAASLHMCARQLAPYTIKPAATIVLEDGTCAATPSEVAQRWMRHYSTMMKGDIIPLAELVRRSVERQVAEWPRRAALGPSLVAAPTEVELAGTFGRAKRGKAPGVDCLTAEIYKLDPRRFALIRNRLVS